MVLHRLYTETMNGLKRKFTNGELCMMIDVSNGMYLDSRSVTFSLKADIEDSFADMPGEYEQKWNIDKKELLEKLEKLDGWEISCLQIWARDFWEAWDYEQENSILKYIKVAPTIMQDLAEISSCINKSVELQIKHKQAVKSKTAAIAREETEKARDIIKRIVG